MAIEKKYLKLSEEEYALIYRQTERMSNHIDRTSPREIRRKMADYKALKSLFNKLMKPEEMQTALTRSELRTMQKLATMAANTLENTVIPGYEVRKGHSSNNEERERYEQYATAAKGNLDIYKNLLIKLEGLL